MTAEVACARDCAGACVVVARRAIGPDCALICLCCRWSLAIALALIVAAPCSLLRALIDLGSCSG